MRIPGLVGVPAGTCHKRTEIEEDAEIRAVVLVGEATGQGTPVFPVVIQKHQSFAEGPREELNQALGECVLTSHHSISESYRFAR